VLVRMLSRTEYGTYQQLALLATLSTAILTLGLPASVYYFYDRANKLRDRALTLQTSTMLAISGTVTAAAIALGAPLIVELTKNPALGPLLRYYGAAVGMLIASEHFVQFMIAQDRYRVAVLVETSETVVRVLILVLPLLAGYGLMGLVLANIAYAVLRVSLRNAWLLMPLRTQGEGVSEPWYCKTQLAYSVPLCLMSLVSVVGGMLDRGIVATRFTAADYAIYSVGALEIPLDSIFQASVATVLRVAMPALIRAGRHDEIVRLMREGVRKLSLIVLPCFVFLLVYSHEFITTLFTTGYERSVSVFRIYVFLMPLNMFLLSPVPPAYGRTRINLHVVAVVTAIHVVLSFVLLHWIGFYGPAVSAISTSYLLSIFYFIYARRLTGGTVVQLLPLATFAKVLCAAAVAAGVSKLALSGHLQGLLGLIAAGALYSVTFLAMCFAVRVFSDADRLLARRWIARVSGGLSRNAG
jgi:O-antigen/teichoic acid export membrane protein